MSEGTARRKIATQSTPAYITEAEKVIIAAGQETDRSAARKKYESAQEILKKGLGSGKRTLGDYLANAEVHWELTEPKESINCLKEAIQLAPKDPRAYALLGRYLLYKGLRDQAMNFLDRAIQLDPSDSSTKKLRDRATLQQKKNYAVVGKASESDSQKAQPAGREAQHKQEATRLMQLGKVSEATEELSKAQHGTNHAVDKALAALLYATESEADTHILAEDQEEKSKKGAALLFVLTLSLISVAALVMGTFIQFKFPSQDASAGSEVLELIRKDQISTLQEALLRLDEDAEQNTPHYSGLISALLLHDHGSDAATLETAETYLSEASEEQKSSGIGLLARTLIQRFPEASSDENLMEDLKTARDAENQADPFALMAFGEYEAQNGELEKALSFMKKAALAQSPPARAIHRFAGLLAQSGNHQLSAQFLQLLWEQYPKHSASLSTASALAFLMEHASPQGTEPNINDVDAEVAKDDKKKKKKKKKKKEKGEDKTNDSANEVSAVITTSWLREFVKEQFQDDTRSVDDLAGPAATLAAVSVADPKQNDLVSAMLKRSLGSRDDSPAVRFPELFSKVLDLYLLNLDRVKAKELLETHDGVAEESLDLIQHAVRARVLKGVPKKERRSLRNAKPVVNGASIRLPGGNLTITLTARPTPFVASYNSAYFPEAALDAARNQPGISLSRFQKRMKILSEVKIAEIALQKEDLKGAKGYLNRIRKDARNDPMYHLTVAILRLKEDDQIGARESIEEAIAIAPEDPRIIITAAKILLRVGKSSEVLKVLRKLRRERFVSPNAFAIESRAHIELDDLTAAQRSLDKAMAMAPDHAQVKAANILVSHENGDFDSASSLAKELITSSPEHFEEAIYENALLKAYHAGSLVHAGQTDEAIARLSELSETYEKLGIIKHFLSAALNLSGAKGKSKAIKAELIRMGGPVAEWSASASK